MRVATVLSEDERKARKKAYYAAYYAARYAANKEKFAVRQAAYRAANKDKIVVQQAAYYAANKEKAAARSRVYYLVNPGKDKAKRAAAPDKYATWNRTSALRKYGLTIEQYNAMLAGQNGTCGICKLVCLTGKRLAVDHCHDTKIVRGLLCANCNTGNGSLKESPKNLAASLRYLAKHGKALTTEEVDELTRDLHHYTKD